MKRIIILLISFAFTAYGQSVLLHTKKTVAAIAPVTQSNHQAANAPALRKVNCSGRAKIIQLAFGRVPAWSRTVNLPTTGKFTLEAHYVTKSDFFKGGYPVKQGDSLKKHLDRSLATYRLYDPAATYAGLYKYNSAWTPEEHGKFGQGSIGDNQNKLLDADNELWMMNMMWANGNRPALNSKFLMSYNGRNVVVIAGFETGPSSQTFLGGVTGEVHSWLKSKMESTISIRYLEDQSIATGPCNCLVGTN